MDSGERWTEWADGRDRRNGRNGRNGHHRRNSWDTVANCPTRLCMVSPNLHRPTTGIATSSLTLVLTQRRGRALVGALPLCSSTVPSPCAVTDTPSSAQVQRRYSSNVGCRCRRRNHRCHRRSRRRHCCDRHRNHHPGYRRTSHPRGGETH